MMFISDNLEDEFEQTGERNI